MMYALNREIEYFDMPYIREIVKQAAEDNYTFTAIITALVNHDVFRMQGPEEHANQPSNNSTSSDVASTATGN